MAIWMHFKVRNNMCIFTKIMIVSSIGFGKFSENCILSFIEDSHFPIPFLQKVKEDVSVEVKQKSWRRRVDINVAFYFSCLLVFAILNIFYVSQGCSQNSGYIDCDNVTSTENLTQIIFQYSVPGQAMQFSACYLQLMIIVGLCMDKGLSMSGRFLNTAPLQFLGRISLALYLVHVPLMRWITLIIYGPIEWVDCEASVHAKFPLWGIPIHVVVSILMACVLTFFVEEPVRKFFKKPKIESIEMS